MASLEPLIIVQGVVKDYQALRPLRLSSLVIGRGDVISLMGLDATAAEMLVGLLTGALLPDQGEIMLFGRSTRDVTDSETWLALLDGVGIVTDRAVLVGQFSVEQNIAMPFTLAIDPIADEVRQRVAALAAEVGLASADLAARVGDTRPDVQARVRLARALALAPSVLIAEHPSATLPAESIAAFASDMARIAHGRTLAVLAVTGDQRFARAVGGEILMHEPATGQLRRRSGWRKLFGG
jgi:ABC-type lipoprotein export system ATPase subunit